MVTNSAQDLRSLLAHSSSVAVQEVSCRACCAQLQASLLRMGGRAGTLSHVPQTNLVKFWLGRRVLA